MLGLREKQNTLLPPRGLVGNCPRATVLSTGKTCTFAIKFAIVTQLLKILKQCGVQSTSGTLCRSFGKERIASLQ